MGRAAYIRRRLILMVFVLFGVTVVIFGMVRILPGDPAFLILGDRATDQKAAELREQLGLNRPFSSSTGCSFPDSRTATWASRCSIASPWPTWF